MFIWGTALQKVIRSQFIIAPLLTGDSIWKETQQRENNKKLFLLPLFWKVLALRQSRRSHISWRKPQRPFNVKVSTFSSSTSTCVTMRFVSVVRSCWSPSRGDKAKFWRPEQAFSCSWFGCILITRKCMGHRPFWQKRPRRATYIIRSSFRKETVVCVLV